MNLLLLHGSAKSASRKKLIELKQRFDPNNVVVFEEGSDLELILGNLITPSLFSEPQLTILENPSEDFTNYQPPLRGPATNYQLILWFDHEVNQKKPIMEWAKKNGRVLFSPESREISVFPLLDCLAAKERSAFLELAKLKKAGFDIQYFITMVFYLLRNLVSTPKNAKPFMIEKLQRQRRNFSMEQLTNLYKDVLEIDFKIKSGLLERAQAEFSLVNLFCH